MTPPPDWDVELDDLRRAATTAGITPLTRPADLGVTLDPATAIIARATEHGGTDELSARRRWRVPVLAASAAAAASIVVAAVLQPWGTTRVEASTPQVLDYEFAAAAAISYAPGEDPAATFAELSSAAAATTPQPAPDRPQHVVTDNWFAEVGAGTDQAGSVIVPQISETWLGTDGALRLVERRGKPLTADGRGLPAAGAWDRQPRTADETQPPGTLDPDLPSTLSRDPAALRAELLDRGACPATAPGSLRARCLYEQVVDLTRTYVVPSDLYAAVWAMLGTEDGFRLLGSVKDRAGRAGVGIALVAADRPEYRVVLIADPTDGTLLGTEEILVKSVPGLSLKAPAITSFSAILESSYDD